MPSVPFATTDPIGEGINGIGVMYLKGNSWTSLFTLTAVTWLTANDSTGELYVPRHSNVVLVGVKPESARLLALFSLVDFFLVCVGIGLYTCHTLLCVGCGA